MERFWFLLFSQGEVLTGSTGFGNTQSVVLTPGREQELENGRTKPSSSTRALSYVSLSWLWNHTLSQSSTCTLLCHRKETRAAFLITSFFKICCTYSGGLYCLDRNYTLIYALFGLLLNYRRRQTVQGIPSQKSQLCGTQALCFLSGFYIKGWSNKDSYYPLYGQITYNIKRQDSKMCHLQNPPLFRGK